MAISQANKREILQQFGDSGLQRWGGILAEEWLADLKGPKARSAYREMADNDPIIGAILFAIKQFLMTAKFTVESASNSKQDIEIAEWVHKALMSMEIPLIPDFMAEAVSFVVYGFAPFEILYKESGQFITWKGFAIRNQETVDGWEFAENGEVLGMYQRVPGKGQRVFIPIEKLLLIKTEPRHGSPEGRSLLRNAWTSYYIKKHLQVLEGIGIERDLCGLPILFVPFSVFENKAKREELKEILRSVRRDEEEGLILPHDPITGQKIYNLELVASRGTRQFSTTEIIARYDRAMAQSLMSDLVMVGLEARGSFALAREKRSLLELTVNGLLTIICSAISSQAIPRLVKLNWPDVTEFPVLRGTLPKTPTPDEVSTLLVALARAGYQAGQDAELIRWIKQLIGAPVAAVSEHPPEHEVSGGGDAE